ncbi:thiolase domain-containing protein [Haloechinothrix sp. LS1_15]|uniref:thiolase domain-containing protein n=1 Tax=Haloechinothrix sp. LS1_15 TaxID=2652248 RepID=UPI002947E243|nr:thiolase domain-containing protein [Haloechinothrix sp. LS1_15]MDV6014153.1 lipid-transfer protein [Haloechinothrix sp. LS1_15]
MTSVAVVGFTQAPNVRETQGTTNGVEMLVPTLAEAFQQTGLSPSDIGFWCSGSSDYLAGRAFTFISAIDAIGAFPPINESHVEMDAAWALYEAWVKILTGEVDTALVYGFGKSSAGTLRRVLSLQLDPYVVAPLWPDSISIAGIQARMGMESGRWSEQAMAEVAARSLTDAAANPSAQRREAVTAAELLDRPVVADPLRAHDIAPITDGASVVILARTERAREIVERPAVITGFEHRVDSPSLGGRDLTRSESTRAAGRAAGGDGVELAELHAPFSHQELILAGELGLADGVRINPSGGALAANALFSGGLTRIGEAAMRIIDGTAGKVLAHATSGPALQQNLVAVMEGE